MAERSELTISPRRWWLRWWLRYFLGFLIARLVKCRWSNHRGPFYDGAICLTCGTQWDFSRQRWTWFDKEPS